MKHKSNNECCLSACLAEGKCPPFTVCQCSTRKIAGKAPHCVLHQALQLFAKEQTAAPESWEYCEHPRPDADLMYVCFCYYSNLYLAP